MNLLLVGLGSIGRRHLMNLQSIAPDASIVVLRHAGHDSPADQSGRVRIVQQLDEALASRPAAAFLCSPAPLHIDVALRLAEQGVHLFIEKPLSDTLDRVDRLIERCQQKHLVLMVGYNLRFHPSIQRLQRELSSGRIGRLLTLRAEVGQYLPHWRPAQDYRTTVSARRELGGGALLELSHELDLALWLGGAVRSVHATVDRLSDLAMDVEDTAALTLRFADGALGSVHLDMLQQPPTRTLKAMGSQGTLLWDAFAPGLRWYDNRTAAWTVLAGDEQPDRNAMYITELQHFFACIANHATPLIDGSAGRRVLALVQAARTSAETGRTVAL